MRADIKHCSQHCCLAASAFPWHFSELARVCFPAALRVDAWTCALVRLIPRQAGRMEWGANNSTFRRFHHFQYLPPGAHLTCPAAGLVRALRGCMAVLQGKVAQHGEHSVWGWLLLWAVALHLKASCSQHCKTEIHWLMQHSNKLSKLPQYTVSQRVV